jgi:hypothetical protein
MEQELFVQVGAQLVKVLVQSETPVKLVQAVKVDKSYPANEVAFATFVSKVVIMPREGDFQFIDGERYIYHEAWDNGSGYEEAVGWYPCPVSQQELFQGMAEVQFIEGMEMMSHE